MNRSCSSGSSAAPTLVLDSFPFGTEGMDTLEPLPEEMAMKAAEFAEQEPHVEIPAAPQVSWLLNPVACFLSFIPHTLLISEFTFSEA